MTDFRNAIYQTSVDFVLLESKQHILINFITTHTPLNMADLARTLSISSRKLLDVSQKKSYLTSLESKRLVQYFCVICGY